MLLEICRRADDGISLRAPQRDGDHVARHEVGHPHPEIEFVSDYVDQSSFGDEIDMNLRMAAEELQYQRRQDLPRRGSKGVDTQRPRWRRLRDRMASMAL